MTKNNSKWWAYKGENTALNGLTEWLYKNTDMNSYRSMLNLIIQFGLEHDLVFWKPLIDFDNKDSVRSNADAVAKQVQSQGIFDQFTQWVQKRKP